MNLYKKLRVNKKKAKPGDLITAANKMAKGLGCGGKKSKK